MAEMAIDETLDVAAKLDSIQEQLDRIEAHCLEFAQLVATFQNMSIPAPFARMLGLNKDNGDT